MRPAPSEKCGAPALLRAPASMTVRKLLFSLHFCNWLCFAISPKGCLVARSEPPSFLMRKSRSLIVLRFFAGVRFGKITDRTQSAALGLFRRFAKATASALAGRRRRISDRGLL
jgi:hypothetical protein